MLHDRKMLQSLSVHPGACSDQDNDNEGEQKETTRRQREIINKCLKKTLKFLLFNYLFIHRGFVNIFQFKNLFFTFIGFDDTKLLHCNPE